MAYIGTRPTFGAGERQLEVYLLDERRELYGEEITVEFVERVRPDQTYATPEQLSDQIGLDVARAREILVTASRSQDMK